jgi:hypothetical protein
MIILEKEISTIFQTKPAISSVFSIDYFEFCQIPKDTLFFNHQPKFQRKKKNRGDESIQVIMHIYMEMSQGNSLCSYLKQTKMSLFFLLQN